MNKYDFELLAKYNKEVNEKINNIIKNLSEDEWNKKFSGFYKSIHEICSHIFMGDYLWLNRFRTINTFESLDDSYFNKKYDFQEILFDNIPEYIIKRKELDKIIIDFTNELDEDDFDKILKFSNKKGILFEKELSVCLLHLSHHETHHRGMISIYLEMLGKENDFSNLYPYG